MSDLTGYVAISDYDWDTAGSVEDSPEEACWAWWENSEARLDEDCNELDPPEGETVSVYQVKPPELHGEVLAGAALEELYNTFDGEMPDGLDPWPPLGEMPLAKPPTYTAHRQALNAAILLAVLDYLEASTRTRGVPWWTADEDLDGEKWIMTGGEWRKKP